ncbi:hypothetical protein P0D72_40360 [Paraburkholderia sediminicola]|uniref:hypothetical protein n=1 Tax=Paraburkholderia sediminicola TaxID=458836 RepID=UPI0038BA0F4F
MIPVEKKDAPNDFDSRVRQKGLYAIAELVGELPEKRRRGPPRKSVAVSRDEIPADKFPPYWRDVLPDMALAYGRMCAYLALYIEHATGSPSVDHVVPKSKKWDQVYEWDNYRLACSLINAKKNNLDIALDPFSLSPNMFAIEFVEFQIKPGPAAVGNNLSKVLSTIEDLGLNMEECCKARREYVVNYELGPGSRGIDLSYLTARAPFIASELRRQGLLLRGDV